MDLSYLFGGSGETIQAYIGNAFSSSSQPCRDRIDKAHDLATLEQMFKENLEPKKIYRRHPLYDLIIIDSNLESFNAGRELAVQFREAVKVTPIAVLVDTMDDYRKVRDKFYLYHLTPIPDKEIVPSEKGEEVRGYKVMRMLVNDIRRKKVNPSTAPPRPSALR